MSGPASAVMDFDRQIRKIAKLRSLARDAEGTPEGDNAARAIGAMIAKCEYEVAAGDFDNTEARIARRHPLDDELAQFLSVAMSVDARKEGSTAFLVSGPRILTEEFARLFRCFRDRCEGFAFAGMLGMLMASFGQEVMEAVDKARSENPQGGSDSDEGAESESEADDADAYNPTKYMAEHSDLMLAFAESTDKQPELKRWGGLRRKT